MAKQITAKVKLMTRDQHVAGGQVSLTFVADYQDDRNKAWAEATPALSVSMTVKADVAEEFQQGDAFTLTFEKAVD
jgi:hypothetical protein